MSFLLQPWQLILVCLAAWLNREQQRQLEFYRTQVQVLLDLQGKKRILLNDDQRRRLALQGKVLGRKAMLELTTIVTPDTILRWHRKFVAEKWDYSDRRRPGPPPIAGDVRELVIRMAKENPSWGYDRIAGATQNLGHAICDESVGNILKHEGIEPAPERRQKTSWKAFIKSHWDVMAAVDFTTVEVWTKGGLVTLYLLFAMELKTRRVYFAGCTPNPNDRWMQQTGRNLTDCEDGFLNSKRYVLMDRDTKFCESFRNILNDAGVNPVRLPPRSPNLNAHLERFFGSLKNECLGRLILFGEKSLRHIIAEFVSHYHHERNHKGLGNKIIQPFDGIGE